MNSDALARLAQLGDLLPAGAAAVQSLALFANALFLLFATALVIFAARMAAGARRDRLAAEASSAGARDHLAEIRLLSEQIERSAALRFSADATPSAGCALCAAEEAARQAALPGADAQARIARATSAAIPKPHLRAAR